jgi:hypothetical protein
MVPAKTTASAMVQMSPVVTSTIENKHCQTLSIVVRGSCYTM